VKSLVGLTLKQNGASEKGYIQIRTALLFGIYIPELFPTEIRLRASGICNTFGRGATIVTPFVVVSLFQAYGVSGVLNLMVGLLILQILVVLLLGIATSASNNQNYMVAEAASSRRSSCECLPPDAN
jgi:putative MFS transporter